MIKIAQWEIIGKWGSKARYEIAKDRYDYVYNMYLIMSFLKMKKIKNFKFDRLLFLHDTDLIRYGVQFQRFPCICCDAQ